MNVGDFLERWGRALFEAPLAALPQPQEPPELAEIRLAVLDQLQAKTSSGGGRKVFLYDLLRVNLRGVPESSAPVFRGSFFRQYLEHEVKDALRNAGSRYPENLRVAIEVTAGVLPAGEPWLSVEPGQQEPASSRARPPAKLVVRAGSANVSELPIEKGRTHIGRSNDVIRSQGIFRRNDLVFSEDNDVSRSVSREHAHIDYDKTTGECRLFNDRWYKLGSPDCATWIVRDGLSHEVHRNGRGIKLEHGDEIHFGQAVVVFERLAS
ncbi:MAG TPA: FHA domain-containing protein [Bryobacteraceae bacterium]|nr:FHA domain-containing protein [Bryobacteraceae bacterium]